MKILTLFSLTLIFLSTNLFSQTYEYVPFPTGNAIWSEFYQTSEFGYPPYFYRYYDKVAMTNEDTIVNGKTYKKLYIFNDSIFNIYNATYLGGIREENKIIYYWGDTIHISKPVNLSPQQEMMLYDYNVNIGDTLLFSNSNFFDIIVENIDTVLIGNSLRKRFSFQSSAATWIEGIGNTQGMLFASGPMTTKGAPTGSLICFKQNDTIVYFNSNYPECMPLYVQDKTTLNEMNVSIFPNPACDNLYVELKENINDFSIIVYNLLGQEIKREKLNQLTNKVNVSDLTNGIYNLRITNKNETANFKIIKE